MGLAIEDPALFADIRDVMARVGEGDVADAFADALEGRPTDMGRLAASSFEPELLAALIWTLKYGSRAHKVGAAQAMVGMGLVRGLSELRAATRSLIPLTPTRIRLKAAISELESRRRLPRRAVWRFWRALPRPVDSGRVWDRLPRATIYRL